MRFKASTLAAAMCGPLAMNEGIRALLSHSDKYPFGWGVGMAACGTFAILVLARDVYTACKEHRKAA